MSGKQLPGVSGGQCRKAVTVTLVCVLAEVGREPLAALTFRERVATGRPTKTATVQIYGWVISFGVLLR